jgi:phosphatidylserine/phosphatidylglycerophosphate/cardiolipin synthase-like enzyme
VQALVDGPETFAAMFHDIATARARGHYIYLLGWVMEDSVPLIEGNPKSTMRVLLESAAASSVQIRVMLWHQVARKYLEKNLTSVDGINRLKTGAAILDAHTPTRFNSHHQKVLLVKGESGLVGYCGGIDIFADRVRVAESPEALSDSGQNGTPLHDVHCRVVGRAAYDLLDVFIQRWRAHPDTTAIDGRAKLLGYSDAPPARESGSVYARVARTFNCTHEPGLLEEPSATASSDPEAQQSVPLDIKSIRNACAKERSIRDILFAAIKTATRFIYLEEQYLIDEETAGVLRKRLPYLQHVTVLIPHSAISDLPDVRNRRKRFLDAIGPAPATLRTKGGRRPNFNVFNLVTPETGKPGAHCYVHAKTWIFDDEMVIIGSANCNRRGMTSDSEANICAFDAPSPDQSSLARKLRMRLWAEHLGVPESAVSDGVGSVDLWFERRPGSRVRLYDPNEGRDRRILPIGPKPLPGAWVDPDFADLQRSRHEDCRGGNYSR